MKKWVLVLGATAGLAAVALLVGVARQRLPGVQDDVPEILADCQERLNRLEADLNELRSS